MRVSAAVAVTCIALLAATTAHAKRVPPASLQQLATAWVGRTGIEWVRIDLRADGTGVAAFLDMPPDAGPATAYRITHTRLVGYDVSFRVEPGEPRAEPIFLGGHADASGMTLNFGGTNGKWKRKVQLQRLNDIVARLKALDHRIGQISARGE